MAMLFVDLLTPVDSLEKQVFRLINAEIAFVAITTHREIPLLILLQMRKWEILETISD